jgi:signal transduction histidine kinase
VADNGKVNILLVDDRQENLLVLRETLASLNENVVEARSGQEALKYLLDRDFAVILLDVMMPEMDGFETAKLIREREKSRHTPIIFITAMLRSDADAFKGYSVGAVDYIMKPFQPEIVRSKVGIFVDLFRKTEEIQRQAARIRQIEQKEFQARLTEAERQTELERERARFEQRVVKAIVEHAPMGIVRLTNKHTISEMNEVFAEQFGITADDAKGRKLFELIEWLPEGLQRAVERNEPYTISELSMAAASSCERSTQESRQRYYDIAAWPMGLTDAKCDTIISSLEVTQRVQLATQRKDFVATLAHDLQTPVIASDRALSLVLGKVGDVLEPDTLKLVTMLKKNNENLLHMIESLLDLYHYEAGVQALYFDEVDLRLLIMTCLDELKPLAYEQGLEMHTHLDDELQVVLADRTAIRRVLTNLLDNALKFTPAGGTIDVFGRNQGAGVVIEVQDNGAGISEAEQKHLFERYWHGTARKTFKNSNGLGLYLCKQIIDSHQGRIECESEVGKMTKFRIYLPTTTLSKSANPSRRRAETPAK